MTDSSNRNTPSRKPWFGPKRVGWGLSPRTWQGWAVLIVFAAAVVLIGILAHS